MNRLPIHTTAKQENILVSQDKTRCLPVQIQQTLVGRLQEDIGQVLPQRQRGRVGEQALAHDTLSTSEVARQDQLSAENVGERGVRNLTIRLNKRHFERDFGEASSTLSLEDIGCSWLLASAQGEEPLEEIG